MTRHPATSARALLEDTSGVATVEYVTLLGLVTAAGAVAVISLGVPLLRTFQYAQLVLSMPVP